MDAPQRNWDTPTLPESSVVLVGLLLAIGGLTLREPAGITSLLASLGIGLVVAGTVYIAAEGAEIVRLSLVFVALTALPLFAYGGTVQWIGRGMAGTVVVGAVYSRVS